MNISSSLACPPELTIVIPTFNRKDMLRQCLEPLVVVGERWEIVVVDDASTDGTSGFVESLEEKLPEGRLRYFRLDKNSGAQVCRNHGIMRSRAKFIAFVDSDDIYLPQGAVMLLETLRSNPALDFVYGSVIKTNSQFRQLDAQAIGAPYKDVPKQWVGYHWHTMGAIYRKQFLELKVGLWNEMLAGAQDWEYQSRVKMARGHGVYVDVVVGYWRDHSGPRISCPPIKVGFIVDTMQAINAVAEIAAKSACADRPMRRRLAKRLAQLAIECGASDHSAEKKQCLDSAISILQTSPVLRLIYGAMKLMPSTFDRWLLGRRTCARA